jgi:hypothetical protein
MINKNQLKQAFLRQVQNDLDCGDFEAIDELLNQLLNECDNAESLIFNYLGDDAQREVSSEIVEEFYPEDDSFVTDEEGYIETVFLDGEYTLVARESDFDYIDLVVTFANGKTKTYHCVRVSVDYENDEREYIDVNNEVVYLDDLNPTF